LGVRRQRVLLELDLTEMPVEQEPNDPWLGCAAADATGCGRPCGRCTRRRATLGSSA
jgi:hypothetical protein